MRSQSKAVTEGREYDVIGVSYGPDGRVSEVRINPGDVDGSMRVFKRYYMEVEPWSHDYQI